MIRAALVCVVLFGFSLTALAQAPTAATAADDSAAAVKTPRERFQENPNDLKAWNAYWAEQFQIILATMDADPKAAQLVVDQVEALIQAHEPTQDPAKREIGKVKGSLLAIRKTLAFYQTPLEQLEQTLTANPDSPQALANYQRKLLMELAPLARTEPTKATERVAAVKALLAKTKETAKEKAARDAFDTAIASLASIDREIIASRKQSDLIGQPAAELKFEAWVNGAPISEGELKGKVIILDFWAVWCGPCIATFPHLREWHEKYADKGLVIIGVTKYYNFRWNDEAKQPAKADDDVSVEEEQAMLTKFAESHKLKHRFAIKEDSELNDFYSVRGIPQIVVIDQENKVQLIKVGSGEENAKAVSELLEKLLK